MRSSRSGSAPSTARFSGLEMRCFSAFEIAVGVAAQFHVHPGANRQHKHLDTKFPAIVDAVIRISTEGVEARASAVDGGEQYCALPWSGIVDIQQAHAHGGRADPDVSIARLLHAHPHAVTVTFHCREGALRVIMLQGEITVAALLKAVQVCASASAETGGTDDGDLGEPVLGPAAMTGSPSRRSPPRHGALQHQPQHTHRGGADTHHHGHPPRDEQALLGMAVRSASRSSQQQAYDDDEGGYPQRRAMAPLTRAAAAGGGARAASGYRHASPVASDVEREGQRRIAELRAESEAMRADIRPARSPSASASRLGRSVTPGAASTAAGSEAGGAAAERRRRAAAQRRGASSSRSSSVPGHAADPSPMPRSADARHDRPAVLPHSYHGHRDPGDDEDHRRHGAEPAPRTASSANDGRSAQDRDFEASLDAHRQRIAAGDALVSRIRRQMDDDVIVREDVAADASSPGMGDLRLTSSAIHRTDASPFISPGTPDGARRGGDNSVAAAQAPASSSTVAATSVAAAAMRDRDDFLAQLDREADELARAAEARRSRFGGDGQHQHQQQAGHQPPREREREPVAPTPTASATLPLERPAAQAAAAPSTPSVALLEPLASPTASIPSTPAAALPPLRTSEPAKEEETQQPAKVPTPDPKPAPATKPEASPVTARAEEPKKEREPAASTAASSPTPVAPPAKQPAPAAPAPSGPTTKPNELRTRDGWRELWSDEKSKVYYYNAALKKTTWKVAETPFKDDPIAPTSGAPKTDKDNASASKPPRDLRVSGSWKELWDAKSGRIYYYNAFNKKTTFKVAETPFADDDEEGRGSGEVKPPAPAPKAPPPAKAAPPATPAAPKSTPAASAEPLVEQGVPSKAPPAVVKGPPPPPVTAPPPKASAPPPIKAPPPVPPPKKLNGLPPPTPPVSAPVASPAQDAAPALAAAPAPPKSVPPPAAPTPAATGPVAAQASASPSEPPKAGDRSGPWLCKQDDKTGRLYFKQTETKQTTWSAKGTPWEGVGGGGAEQAASPVKKKEDDATATADPKAPVQRNGWVRKFDEKSGKFYFKNITTKETTWNAKGTPFESDVAAASPAKAAAAAHVDAAEAADRAPITIDGWTRSWDQRKGKFYYTERETKKSQYAVAGTPFEKMAT